MSARWSRTLPLLALALLALSCGPVALEPEFLPLDARGQLLRLSVDLRGVHPSEAELRAIEANPERYGEFVEEWLHDPRFLERIRALFNERFLTRTGDVYFDPAEVGLDGIDERLVARSVGDEPLRLVSFLVEHDLPWTEVVLADHTMADTVTARMWDVEPDDPSFAGWQPGRYNDGRPHAGVLTMTTMWQRYPSAGGNANRHRANATSRILLCDDYLDRPIAFSRADVDQISIDPENAIATNEACQACHSSLDPLAAHFFGFWSEGATGVEATVYRPEAEALWHESTGVGPGWFGRPSANLHDLGRAIAGDPRFATCAVRTLFEGLMQRNAGNDDWGELLTHRDVFEESGLVVRDLVRSIVESDSYRAAEATVPETADRVSTVRVASPAQLASIVEELTGYRWSFGGVDALTDPGSGLVTLAGGVDGSGVRAPDWTPSVSLVLVHERLAWSAAWSVAQHDLGVPVADRLLLTRVTAEDTPEDAPDRFDAQIRDLYLRITGRLLLDGASEPDRLATLWKQVWSVEGSSEAAWAAVVAAVLRDPAVLLY